MLAVKSPQLSWLRSFEAVIRHKNVTKAAHELNLTQGAISQHIRKLESLLETPLFVREGKSMTPSRAGMLYSQQIASLLEMLDEATNQVSSSEMLKGALTISVPTSFGIHWLIPRLPNFRQQYPDIQLHILNRDVNFTDNADRIDLSIEFLPVDIDKKNSQLFFYEDIIPICSPAYAKTQPKIERAEDLLKWDLLLMDERFDHTSQCWWEKHLNLRTTEKLSGYRFERHAFVIEAAIAGMGVGLVPKALVEDEIVAGRLTRPLPLSCYADEALAVVIPHYQIENFRCRIFKDWLLDQSSSICKP